MTTHKEKRARRRWGAEEKRALVNKWQESGLSARQFGLREGVPAANLLNWLSSEPSAAVPQRAAVKFTPVQVAPTRAAPEQSADRAVLELVLHGGARVRVLDGADARMVSELVLAVARGV